MDMSEFYITLAVEIITEQEQIIGPLAWEQAKKVRGLKVETKNKITIGADPKATIDLLVKQYEQLFGKTSVSICHLATQRVVRKYSVEAADIPESLRG